MPVLEIIEEHKLTREEAVTRIQNEIGNALKTFSAKISDFEESWNGNRGNVSFSFQNFSINCDLTVTSSEVITKTKLPFIVMMFKDQVENTLRPILRQILNR